MRPVLKDYILQLPLQINGAPTLSSHLAATHGECSVGLLVLPASSCDRLAMVCAPTVLCTAMSVAKQAGVIPDAKVLPIPADNMESMAESCSDDDDDDGEDTLYAFPLSVILRCIMLMQRLKNAASMGYIVRLASSLVLPADQYAELLSNLDTGKVKILGRNAIQRAAVKLDYISLLFQRELFRESLATNAEWCSQFGGDSSPQGYYFMSVGTGANFALLSRRRWERRWGRSTEMK